MKSISYAVLVLLPLLEASPQRPGGFFDAIRNKFAGGDGERGDLLNIMQLKTTMQSVGLSIFKWRCSNYTCFSLQRYNTPIWSVVKILKGRFTNFSKLFQNRIFWGSASYLDRHIIWDPYTNSAESTVKFETFLNSPVIYCIVHS